MISSLGFVTLEYKTYFSRSRIEQLFAQDSPSQIKSPRMNRAAGNKQRAQQRQQQQQQQQSEPYITIADLPSEPVGNWGITAQVFTFLEVCPLTPSVCRDWSRCQS